VTNTYRASTPAAAELYEDGVFEREFTAAEESDALAAGVVIVPRRYRVLSDNFKAGPKGAEVELALRVAHEGALLVAGHLERVRASGHPAGNASRDEWAAYALASGAAEADLLDDDGEELGRDALRDKYAPDTRKG
jgi:hypothetical protein